MIARETTYRDRALRSLGMIAPFPPILHRLIATLAREDVQFSDLAQLIEKDTVLTGHVLRLVNSAAFGRSGNISSVRHAISLLGVTKLRNSLMGLSISRMWLQVRTPRNWSAARFNEHAVAAAVWSDLLAQRVPVDYPEGAFAAGLLHDFGQLLIAYALVGESEMIQALYEEGGRTLEECEIEVIGISHAELSALALARWNIPLPIRVAVQFHHDPDRALAPAPGARKPHLSHVVFAANRLSHLVELSAADQDCEIPDLVGDILYPLEIRDALRLIEEFRVEFGAIREDLVSDRLAS